MIVIKPGSCVGRECLPVFVCLLCKIVKKGLSSIQSSKTNNNKGTLTHLHF